jgi:hypothetical protein
LTWSSVRLYGRRGRRSIPAVVCIPGQRRERGADIGDRDRPTEAPSPSQDDRTLNRREFLTRSALLGATITAAGGLALPDLSSAATRRHILWGASCLPRARQKDQKEAMRQMERRLGRKFDVATFRMGWQEPLVNHFTSWSVASGHIPLLSWNTRKKSGGIVSWSSIAAGDHDAWIRRQARNLRAAGWRGFIAFHHEPEKDGNAADWKAAFNRVHKIFHNTGVTRFRWLVTLTAATYSGENGGPGLWLPAKWDVLGVDGYNRNFCGSSNGWRSFEEVFGPARRYAKRRSRRLFIQEYGSVESTPGRKAQWIDRARSVLKSWPEVAGVSYNHEATDCVYWIDSSRSSFHAFRKMGQDRRF